MTHCLVLTLLLIAADGPQKPASDPDRARRAAIVDGVMGEPDSPRFRPNQTYTTELIEANGAQGKADDGEEDEELADRSIKKPPADEVLMVVLRRENFDRWVFGNMQDDRSRRAWLEHQLRLRCEQASKTLDLSRPQIEKLRLAGRGDIKRFFDQVEEIRPEFDALRLDWVAGRRFLTDDLKPLWSQFQLGPFGDDSMFTKTLRKIGDDSSKARHDGKSS
jgi:hypothetical protein